MAKSLKKLALDKINWATTIKNFNRYSKDNKLAALNIVGNALAGKFGNVALPIGPEYDDFPVWLWPYITPTGRGRVLVVIIHGKKKKIDGIGPRAQAVVADAVNAKDVKFDRFASNGIQHLVVTAPDTKFEIMVFPK